MAEQIYRLNSSLSDANFQLSCESLHSKAKIADQSLIELIHTYDDPEKAEIILPDGQKFVWYFAIGSMMNPISLHLRDLTPLVSYPARCPNYKLIFRASIGMADIEPCPEAEFHGVVHLLSAEQMARLDIIEMGYNRILVNSINYQDQSHTVYVYKMGINLTGTCLPSERYLDIIVKGCEYFKVHSDYTNRLKEQAVRPRKQPHTFLSVTNIPPDVFYSEEELAKHNGDDPSLPLWISINGKILEHTGLSSNDHPDHEIHKRFYTFIKTNMGGREVAPLTARNLYDPLYKLPSNDTDLCERQRAEIEDEVCTRLRFDQNQTFWKPIGRLRTTNSPL